MQAGLEHVRLNADFAFGRDDATGRQLRAEVAPLLVGYLSRADVDQESPQDDDQQDYPDGHGYHVRDR
jgi:hypothetical protein